MREPTEKQPGPSPTPKAPAFRVASDFEPEAPAVSRPDPAVLIVTERPSRGKAGLLPPLLIVFLGVCFLAYRSRADNWRGLAAFFDANAPAAPTLVAQNTPPAPAPAPPPPPEAVAPGDAPEAETPVAPKPPEPEAPAVKAEDPVLSDIEAEAKEADDRIAALQRQKDEEARALAETEDERRDAEQQAFRLPRFMKRGAMPPEEVEKMVEAGRDQMRKQLAWVAELQRRQMDEMMAMRNRFLRDGFDSPPPDWPPAGMGMPSPFPEPPLLPRATRPGNGFKPVPGGRTFRTPDGGQARIEEFRGPGGMTGFGMHWQSGDGKAPAGRFFRIDPMEEPPPPPRPGKRFD